MRNWSQTVLDALGGDEPSVLVTLISEEGSVPRAAGARMLVLPDGSIQGTVGGGKYEALAIEEAASLCREWSTACHDRPTAIPPARTMRFSLQGVHDRDMICGGELFLLLELLPPDGPTKDIFAAAARAQESEEPFAYLTHITGLVADANRGRPLEAEISSVTARRHVYRFEPHSLTGPETIPEHVLSEAKSAEEPLLSPENAPGDVYLIEPFPAPWTLHIFGGGHVAKAVADLAYPIDFQTVILEDRPEFARAERFPHSKTQLLPTLRHEDTAAYLKTARIGAQSGIVILTRGHAHDRDVLTAALEVPAGYVGMIGSRRKWGYIRKNLMEYGISAEALDSVYTPIGLDIGADTPEEIAVSIAAELIAWRRGKEIRR